MKAKINWLLVFFLCIASTSISFAQAKKKDKEKTSLPIKLIPKNKIIEAQEFFDDSFSWIRCKYDKDENILESIGDKLEKNTLNVKKEWRSTYVYNIHGKIISEVYELWHDRWILYSNSTWEYDNNKNNIHFLYKDNYSQVNTNMDYDKSGRMILIVSERKSENKLVNVTKENFHYDLNGLKLSRVYKYYENHSLINKETNEYKYDDAGRMILNKSYSYYGGMDTTLQHTMTQNITYDIKGNILTDFQTNYRSGKISSIYKVTNTYDSLGNKLTEIKEMSYSSPIKIVFIYDDSNRLIQKVLHIVRSGIWIPDRMTKYSYEPNIIRGVDWVYIDNDWKPSELREPMDFEFMNFEPVFYYVGPYVEIRYFEAKK